MKNATLKKILVVRFSSIGDIVLTTPVLRCIKQKYHDCEIHYITKNKFRNILEHNPYVSKLFGIEKSVMEVLKDLKKEKYDLIVDLHKNIRTARLKAELNCKSVSLHKINYKKWLIVNFKINHLPALHIVDRYMSTVSKFGIVNDNKGLDYFIPIKDEVKLSTLPTTHQQGYVAFVIGGQKFTKKLPNPKVIEIIKHINCPVILMGGKEDTDRGDEIAAAAGANTYNSCGLYNLNQAASIIKQSKRVITNDTGLMHIAAAFKKDIYSAWGNTMPEFGFAPYMPGEGSKMIEVKDLKCRPCSKLGFHACPKKHFHCMNDLRAEEFQ